MRIHTNQKLEFPEDDESYLVCDGCHSNDRHANYSGVFIMNSTPEEKRENEGKHYCKDCIKFYERPEQQKNKCTDCRKLTDVECHERMTLALGDVIRWDSNVHQQCKEGYNQIGKTKYKCTPNPFSKGIGCSVCGNLL